jgi:hypothetical protein
MTNDVAIPAAPAPAPARGRAGERPAGGRLAWTARAAQRATPWLLGAALLAFVLPFASVSCATPAGYGSAGGGVTATYAGLTLVTGGEPAIDPADRPLTAGATRDEDRVAPQPAAAGALALAVAALVLAIVGGARPRSLAVAILATGSAALLAVALAEFDRLRTGRIVAKLSALGVAARPPDEVAAFVQPDRGFWVVVALLLVTAAVNLWAAAVGRRGARPAPDR